MDCFNFFCSLRQNTTSNYNYCGHLACQNRYKEPIILYTALVTKTANNIKSEYQNIDKSNKDLRLGNPQ